MTAPLARRLLRWFDRHGRTGLPWQRASASGHREPYRVWLSEVMLQQTQVSVVIGYFERFIRALPTLRALAAAEEDTVLALWSGLGYYRRARFLQRAAQQCVQQHGGELPRDFIALSALPGIGRSTAGAILAQAHGLRFAILDGNVKRVLARYHGIHGHPGQSAVEQQLWQLAETHTPTTRVADYTQAIMDLGATLCTRSHPQCARCPVSSGCVALCDGLTTTLPEAKPKRALPTRATAMLIVRDAQGRVLLERRPPTGVWARLWSLPEVDNGASALGHLRERYAVHVDTTAALDRFVHTFSHYHLQVTPLLFTGAATDHRVADDPDRGWYSHGQFTALGLPAPVRKLLETLEESQWLATSTA